MSTHSMKWWKWVRPYACNTAYLWGTDAQLVELKALLTAMGRSHGDYTPLDGCEQPPSGRGNLVDHMVNVIDTARNYITASGGTLPVTTDPVEKQHQLAALRAQMVVAQATLMGAQSAINALEAEMRRLTEG